MQCAELRRRERRSRFRKREIKLGKWRSELLLPSPSGEGLGMRANHIGIQQRQFFLPADEEFLLFIDKKNKLEIIVRELSTETNFNSSEIKTEKEFIFLFQWSIN